MWSAERYADATRNLKAVMLKLIKGLPPDVLDVEVFGKLTPEDYRTVQISAAEAKSG